MRIILGLCLALVAILGLSSPALAHSLETNYLISPQSQLQLHTQFSTGEPFQQAPVRVFSPADDTKPWLEGKTDAKGEFAFAPDRSLRGDWFVEIGEFTQSNHSDALTLAVDPQGIQVKDVTEKQASYPWGKQMLVLGFAALSGGIGRKLLASR